MVSNMKTPATKPAWTTGSYAVHVDGLLIGYFRRFESAHHWRVYLAATTDASAIYIERQGQVVNIWRRENVGAA